MPRRTQSVTSTSRDRQASLIAAATSLFAARGFRGTTTKEIAKRLQISGKTAENHRTRVLDKLGVRNTAELVRYAMRKGLMD